MRTTVPWTKRDTETYAELWSLALSCFDSQRELAGRLGVARSSITTYANGSTPGPFPLLRVALREAARHKPEDVPRLVEAVARLLFDVEGEFIPDEPSADAATTPRDGVLGLLSGVVHALEEPERAEQHFSQARQALTGVMRLVIA